VSKKRPLPLRLSDHLFLWVFLSAAIGVIAFHLVQLAILTPMGAMALAAFVVPCVWGLLCYLAEEGVL